MQTVQLRPAVRLRFLVPLRGQGRLPLRRRRC
jgi:hypothetical protein